MAQWVGQFTGLSHWSKLADAEATLRIAVEAFRAAPPDSAVAKSKAVRKQAARVLTLTLKKLKAIRNRHLPVDNASLYAQQLQEPERAVQAGGIAGILAEFGAADASA